MFMLIFVKSGYKSPLPLPCTLGRQWLWCWRAADLDVPVVPYVRSLHKERVHPCTCLLCTSCGLPCTLPLGGKRIWRVSEYCLPSVAWIYDVCFDKFLHRCTASATAKWWLWTRTYMYCGSRRSLLTLLSNENVPIGSPRETVFDIASNYNAVPLESMDQVVI